MENDGNIRLYESINAKFNLLRKHEENLLRSNLPSVAHQAIKGKVKKYEEIIKNYANVLLSNYILFVKEHIEIFALDDVTRVFLTQEGSLINFCNIIKPIIDNDSVCILCELINDSELLNKQVLIEIPYVYIYNPMDYIKGLKIAQLEREIESEEDFISALVARLEEAHKEKKCIESELKY